MFGERTHRMFNMTHNLLKEKERSESFEKLFNRIQKYENISDRMELEIANYLNHISPTDVSLDGENKIHSIFKVVDEIESIGDSCYNLARTITRKAEAGATFTPGLVENIDKMFDLTNEVLEDMKKMLAHNEVSESDLNKLYNKENEINNYRSQLRNNNIDDINKDRYGYLSGIFYMDLINECEKISDHVVNVAEALREKKFNTHFNS